MSHGNDGEGFSTRAIRLATTPPEVHQTANAVPIYQSATFSAADAAELGDILTDADRGYAYSRIENPTAAAMAAAVAGLEGAEAGFAFGSGMAAIHATLLSILSAGDHVVATSAVYGSTRTLLAAGLARLGVGQWRPRDDGPQARLVGLLLQETQLFSDHRQLLP